MIAGELAADPVQAGRQHPVLKGRAVAQRTRLARQHRHVVPGIEDGLVAAEAAAVLADAAPVGLPTALAAAPGRTKDEGE